MELQHWLIKAVLQYIASRASLLRRTSMILDEPQLYTQQAIAESLLSFTEKKIKYSPKVGRTYWCRYPVWFTGTLHALSLIRLHRVMRSEGDMFPIGDQDAPGRRF